MDNGIPNGLPKMLPQMLPWVIAALSLPVVLGVEEVALYPCGTQWGTAYIGNYSMGGNFPAPVDVLFCYTPSELVIQYHAYNELVYFNRYEACNGPLYQDEVLEAFVARTTAATADAVPIHYLETELSPQNLSFTALITNTNGSGPAQTTFISCPSPRIVHSTTLDRPSALWHAQINISWSVIPDSITGRVVPAPPKTGDVIRGNFFRVWAPEVPPGGSDCTFDTCKYGAWAPTGGPIPHFHVPKVFGKLVLQ
jgi:hypothetical protein